MINKKEIRANLLRAMFLIAVTILFVIFLFQQPAFASWVDTDSSIYKSGVEATKKDDVLQALSSIYNKIKDIASDLLGAMFSDMLINLGDSLYYLLALAGLDLNSIIYGRVGGAAFMNDGVSLFTFELVEGNPYGIVASYMYGALRMLFVLILICIVISQLSMYLYSNGGGRQRDRLKESMSLSVILLLMLMLMPYLLGVVIYLRDVLLYVEMITGGTLIEKVADTIHPSYLDSIRSDSINKRASDMIYSFFGSTGEYNIITMFREAAGGNLLNSFMYVGAVVMTIYFAFSYISAALSMVVLFVSFPMACVSALFDRSIMKNWIKQVVGVLIIPVLDSVLLIIPIFFGLFGKSQSMSGYTIVQFILCCSIIPARGCLRMWLGLGGGNGMELAGIGALMGAMQLGKAVAGAAIGIASGRMVGNKSAKSDESMASMYSDMQKAKDFNSSEGAAKLDEDMNEIFGMPKMEDAESKKSGREEDSFHPGFKATSSEGDAKPEGSTEKPGSIQGGFGTTGVLKDKIGELGKKKAVLTDDMKKNDVRLAQINKETALLDEDNALLKAERDEAKRNGPVGDEHAANIERHMAENEIAKKGLAIEATDLRGRNAIKAGQISRIDTATKLANDSLISAKAASGRGVSSAEQEVLDKYASIDNFETPDFKNISDERRAELYRERARNTRANTNRQSVMAASGAMVGATVAVGATMFGNPSAKMYSIATGIHMGTEAGNIASEVIQGNQSQSMGSAPYLFESSEGVAGARADASIPNQNNNMVQQQVKQNLPDLQVKKQGKVTQTVLVDNELSASTTYEGGKTIYNDVGGNRSQDKASGGTDHQWIPGGETVTNERIWSEVISSSAGQKCVTNEIRRAMTTASSSARTIKRSLDVEPGRSSEEKNEDILNNAVNAFTSEFSYNMVNSGAIPERTRNTDFNSDKYQDFLKTKIRSQAKDILKDKLRSLGLMY